MLYNQVTQSFIYNVSNSKSTTFFSTLSETHQIYTLVKENYIQTILTPNSIYMANDLPHAKGVHKDLEDTV